MSYVLDPSKGLVDSITTTTTWKTHHSACKGNPVTNALDLDGWYCTIEVNSTICNKSAVVACTANCLTNVAYTNYTQAWCIEHDPR